MVHSTGRGGHLRIYTNLRRSRLVYLMLLICLPFLLYACQATGDQDPDPTDDPGMPVVEPEEPAGQPDLPPFPIGAEADPDHVFDIVITGGRIMDPETNFDRVGNVGIDDGTVTAITGKDIRGRVEINADGLVVAPGFIDILSYAPNSYGIWYKIQDGVTTNLGMHGLAWDAASWFAQWEKNRPPTHFGGAFSILRARERLGLGAYQKATPAQRQLLVEMFEQSLHDGFIGIDISLEYAPGITYEDIVALAQVAAKYDVPVFFHARYSSMEGPGTNIDALNEIISVARETGASVHVEHINSTGGTFSMAESLALLEQAIAEGLDITACVYPYNFWATYLGSARFDPGWQERFRISYEDLEIAGTGERLTAETFAKYRRQNKLAVAYAIPEEDVRLALQAPFVMLGSDSILEPNHNQHPRSTGTFARTLGYYVREEGVISLMDALRKMTIMPAKRLERQVPSLRKKGRLQVGSDADITIFNPETVRDQSTVQNPAQPSTGIEWVIIAGQVVLTPEGLNKDVRPGQPIKLSVNLPRPAPPKLPSLNPPSSPEPATPPPQQPPVAEEPDPAPAPEPDPEPESPTVNDQQPEQPDAAQPGSTGSEGTPADEAPGDPGEETPLGSN